MSGEMTGKAADLISKDESVLIVIDIQEKLLPVIHEKETVLDNTATLAEFAKIVGIPVVVTEQEKLGPTMSEISDKIDGFEPITKIEFSAFLREEFTSALGGLGRNTAIVTGIEAHVCVTQTVLHLLPEYNVHVISDAVSSRTIENRDVALERMRDAGAVISSTEMVIFELLERAGTDEFRETLKLVK